MTPVLRLTLWLGLVAGTLEAAWRLFQKFGQHVLIHMPLDVVWMAPAIDLVWLILPALLLLLLGRLVPRLATPQVVVSVLGAFAVLPLVLLITSLHKGVAVLLAIGLGMQLGRLAAARPSGFAGVVRKTLPWLGGGVVVVTALVLGAERVRESRAFKERGAVSTAWRPNVILLVWDTVRNQELSVAGYSRPTTPFLESMAKDAVRFGNAISAAPWTLPSHGSMFSGQWPFVFFRGTQRPVVWSGPTLAQVLGSAGYRTAGFTANLAYTTREYEINRGFQHYEDYPRDVITALMSARLTFVLLDERWFRSIIRYYDRLDRKRAGTINHDFLRWLDRDGQRPFFVFLNYFDAHHPYVSRAPFRDRFVHDPPGTYQIYSRPLPTDTDTRSPAERAYWQDEYDALIATLDDATRQLFEELGHRELLDSTIVIVTSDHGEQFGEHGKVFHMNSLYGQLLHVPLLIRYPAAVPRGMVVQDPISTRDIARTVLTLTGVSDQGAMPGQSLTRFWNGEAAGPDSLILSELATNPGKHLGPHSVVSNGLHYIRTASRAWQLFDLAADPAEVVGLEQDPTREADLTRFQQLTDSLSAVYQERAGALETDDE